MTEDLTEKPTVKESTETDTGEQSLKDFIAKHTQPITAAICVLAVVGCVKDLWYQGIGSMLPNIVWWVGFGIYPPVMGFVLERQAKRQDMYYSDSNLILMLVAAILGWIGLVLLLGVLKTVLLGASSLRTAESVFYVIYGVVLSVGGYAAFMKALRLGRAVEPPEFRDPAEAEHTWLVEETGRQNRKWRMSLYPDVIQLEAEDENRLCDVQLIQGRGEIALDTVAGTVSIKAQELKLEAIRLDQDQLAVLKDWIGLPTMESLKECLIKWQPYGITISVIWVFEHTFASYGTGLAAYQWITPISSGLIGIWLVGIVLATHYRPHRVIFLCQTALMVLLALLFETDVILGATTDLLFWGALILLSIIVAIESFVNYRRFAGVQYKWDNKTKMHIYLKLTLLGAVIVLFLVGVGFVRGA